MYIEIQDFSAPEISLYRERSERVLARFLEPHGGYFLGESPLVIQRALAAGYVPVSFLAEKEQLDREDHRFLREWEHLPIYVMCHECMKDLIGYELTRGLLCLMERKPLPDPAMLLKNSSRVVVLEEVVNPTNLGAIFRSAAALGMDAVFLTEDCTDPLYRRAARVSMGTVFQIPWTRLPKENGIELLKQQNYFTVAMALRENSFSLDDPIFTENSRLAVMMGNEGNGLRQETIDACDATVMIPMAHGVDSLNVAAASAVAFWQLGRRENRR